MRSAKAKLLHFQLAQTVHAIRRFASTSTGGYTGVSPKESSRKYAIWGGVVAALGLGTWLDEELEIRNATERLESGASAEPSHGQDDIPQHQLLRRAHTHNRLVDLVKPYVCSMDQVDVVFGHQGSGKTQQLRQACRDAGGGVLYADLEGDGRVGRHLLAALTGDAHRGPLESFRDRLRGGVDAHGVAVLDTAVERYLQRHDRYPVVVLDHTDPQACGLGDPAAPLLQLGRSRDPAAPSCRPVVVVDDAGLEALRRDLHPASSFRVVATEDASTGEALQLLAANRVPASLAEAVVGLVGGRLAHLQLALRHWTDSARWLSPMRPGASQRELDSLVNAHLSEIKKLVFWDLDKRLRMEAKISLWPSATGDAPVHHQSPTDEDAVRIVELLHDVHTSPLPAAAIKKAIGEERFLQLLGAQILGFLPEEGPLGKMQGLVGFGSPAMQKYFEERLQTTGGEAGAGKGKSSAGGISGALRGLGL